MFLATIILIILLRSWTCWAQVVGLTAPLFTSSQIVTSTFYTVTTVRLTKRTPCFVTAGFVSQCGQKRGIEEEPNYIIHHMLSSAAKRFQEKNKSYIAPSQVVEVEVTAAPSSADVTFPTQLSRISSSFVDKTDDNYYHQLASFSSFIHRLASDTLIFATLNENCAGTTVNLSKFLSCLGLMSDVQQTTVTVTRIALTQTTTLSTGYVPIMTLVGCTPLSFPLLYCPQPVIFPSSTAVGRSMSNDKTNYITNYDSTDYSLVV